MKNHLIEIDQPTGDEYIMGDIEGYVKNIDDYYSNAEDATNIYHYNQLELSKKYSRNYCTIYGPMAALATKTGYNLSIAEREELMKLRKAESDFDEAVGGYTSRGVDIARKWWNMRHPENPVVSFTIDNSSELRKKLFGRKIPLVTSFRGNASFNKDTMDGKVDGKEWGKTSYGHCRMMTGLTIYDNYKDKRYSYPSVDHFYDVMKNGYERPQSFVFFLENELSGNGKKLVDAMKAKIWNGERENDILTRFEASRIALRVSLGKVEESKIWNGKDGDKPVSKFELFTMLSKANKKYKPYLGTDRNQTSTRKEAILSL